MTPDRDTRRGLAALRLAIWHVLNPAEPGLATALAGPGWLLTEALDIGPTRPADNSGPQPAGPAAGVAARTARPPPPSSTRPPPAGIIALVELARGGDSEAFGQLYDHYHLSVYRFVYYRVGSTALAEDLTSETFFRALRSMGSFRWQGKDFGAWLMTIARNLTTDHFKAGRTRLEYATEDMSPHDAPTEGPESSVLASINNETLLAALTELPHEQQECLIMRFLQGLSIAETAKVLGRSDGAVKQLQLRGVRNLAKLLPEGMR